MGYQSTDLGACTPTIDALAREGVRLHAYYAMDQCTPSRSSLLSGTYPVNTGMWHSSILADMPFGLPLDFTLLPEWLKTVADYNTQAIGKWDVGHFTPAYLPTSRGFDGFLGYYGASSVVALLLPTTKRAPFRAWRPRDLAPHGSRGDVLSRRAMCVFFSSCRAVSLPPSRRVRVVLRPHRRHDTVQPRPAARLLRREL